MNNQSSKKKGIIIAGISAIVLIAVLGISFAVWNYSRTTDNQILVAGDIYMKFKENPALTIENAMPSEGPGQNDYFEFTIEGVNKYNKPIWYEIDIQHGEPHETRGTRIEDNLLAFKLVEFKEEGQEEVLIEKGSYTGLAAGKGIYVNTIPAGTNSKITRTYRLYMWISSKTIIGNTIDANYDMDEWNDVYASIKVNVTGDFNEKEIKKEIQYGIGTEALKSIAVSNIEDTCTEPDYTGELVAINTEGKLYQGSEGEEIREYRYVGPEVDNYIYFNCEDNKEPSASTCEIWRILGIFKDEEGQEHIKIVKNNTIPSQIWDSSTINDWVNSNLKEYLNTTYYNSLTTNAKDMIAKTKYYLGNYKNGDTTINLYSHERGDTTCSGSCSGGDVWEGNQATWNGNENEKGNIALMYPSDYGYTANSCNWTKATSSSSTMSSSWLLQTANHSVNEWLLSPSSYSSRGVAVWVSTGNVGYGDVAYTSGVRASLNLISGVTIVDGEGTVDKPYQLNSGQ